jgi:hypothetical protein
MEVERGLLGASVTVVFGLDVDEKKIQKYNSQHMNGVSLWKNGYSMTLFC